jgi:hypothetical protein
VIHLEEPPFPLRVAQEGQDLAHQLVESLHGWSLGRVEGRIEAVSSPDGSIHQLQMMLGHYHFVACTRQFGKPYVPARFPTQEDARAFAEVLEARLRPSAGNELEVYVNVNHFASTDVTR